MVAIKKTNIIIPNSNYAPNNVSILIARKSDARNLWVNWKGYENTHWMKYQIKETDFRAKTATFTSPQYLDLTTGVYCVMITTPLHEDFGGIIIDVKYDHKTGLYEYQCQDFSRTYQGKFELINPKRNVHRILQFLITQGGVSTVGAVSKVKLKEFKEVLSGLRPAHQYEQKYWGSIINFNPMTEKSKMIFRGKSWIEAIRDLVLGSGAYIDVYFDKYGIIHIEPYTKDDFFNTGLYLTTPEIAEATQEFDTTNIITGVRVHSTDKTKVGTAYGSSNLINLNLTAIFGNLYTSMDNPTQSTTTQSTGKTTGKTKTKTKTKKSTTKTKTNNPYGTKRKEVWLNSDNIKGKASDRKFLNDVAKILRKHGWKTKIIGVGPNTHTEGYMGPKNGIWFCVYGGADGAVFRETITKNSYTNKLKRLGSRTVIGMHGGGDIRKGGKYYKWLPRAHDDNYSPSSYRGISHPLAKLTKGKVPIMYASNAKKMAAKFLAGGDNPEAC